jgi:uncharacterized protein YqeY
MYGLRILEEFSPKKDIEREVEDESRSDKEEAWGSLKKDLKKALKSQDHDSFVDSILSIVKAAVDKDEVDLDDE